MTMMQWAFILLCAGAGGGVLMTVLIAASVRFPAFLGTGHGLTGLAGLALLYAAHLFGDPPEGVWWSVIIITMALLGGLVLFRTLFRENIPLWLVFGHGGLAAFGLYLIYPIAFGA